MSSITIPKWVTDLVHEQGGDDRYTRFIMTKCLEGSDMDIQRQNRLLIPSQYVYANLIPMLSEAEKGLLHMPTARRKTPGASRVQRRKHWGLEVCVYTRGEFRCHLTLAHDWDSTDQSTAIKGPDYKCLLNRCFLLENDEVEMWAFREGEEGKLCFTLGKKER